MKRTYCILKHYVSDGEHHGWKVVVDNIPSLAEAQERLERIQNSMLGNYPWMIEWDISTSA